MARRLTGTAAARAFDDRYPVLRFEHPCAALASRALERQLDARPGVRALLVTRERRDDFLDPDRAIEAFDIAVLNEHHTSLLALVPAVASRLGGGGVIIATGLQTWQAAGLERALWASGLTFSAPDTRGGWACYVATRRQPQ